MYVHMYNVNVLKDIFHANTSQCNDFIDFTQLQITRIGGPYPSSMDAPSLVLPLVYDVSTNLTQLAEKRDPGPASATTAASLQLKRFAEFGVSHNECSLFPAVRDLLCTLSLPSESQAQVRLLMCDQYKCNTHL
jgi:hypothetical protein